MRDKVVFKKMQILFISDKNTLYRNECRRVNYQVDSCFRLASSFLIIKYIPQLEYRQYRAKYHAIVIILLIVIAHILSRVCHEEASTDEEEKTKKKEEKAACRHRIMMEVNKLF